MNSPLVSRSSKSVRYRYFATFLTSMALYGLAILALSGGLGWQPPRSGLGLYLSALLPALPIGGSIFAVARYLAEEPDEFLRMVRIKATLVGVALTMFTCTAWGFLSEYAHVRSLPLFMVFPMWAGWMGLAMPIIKLKYR
jgi:hypothetical protein